MRRLFRNPLKRTTSLEDHNRGRLRLKNLHRVSIVWLVAAGLLFGCSDKRGNSARVTQTSNEGSESVAKRDAQGASEQVDETTDAAKLTVTAEIWVDNWFSLTVNGKFVVEDSVPFKTERSFNAESMTFSAALPMTLAFTFRDFVENDTGLEYIGSRRQQMGDGGAIAQFTNAETGALIKVTD